MDARVRVDAVAGNSFYAEAETNLSFSHNFILAAPKPHFSMTMSYLLLVNKYIVSYNQKQAPPVSSVPLN